MTTVGEILRRAAADVEVRGVVHKPDIARGETCAYLATGNSSVSDRADQTLILHLGLDSDEVFNIVHWNDSQPSKAVVAAEMRNAGDLADLLYGE